MSAKIMGECYELDIRPNLRDVLQAIADHADHDGKNAFPRLEFIAWKTGYTLRSVKRLVAELRRARLLTPHVQ